MLNNFKSLAIGFCCACALLGSGCSKDGGSAPKLQEGSPEAIAYAFEQALCAGDSQGALKQLALEKQLGADQKDQIAMVQGKLGPGIEKLAKDVKAAGGVKEIKTESAVISQDGNSATVQTVVSFKNSGTPEQKNNLRLVKLDGQWAVSLKQD
ncbi:MAG: DUF4878 domain-containing protein [Succinivibrio sp.]|nr:DUF4878 domain-containing protein [Succinivibrio sp.]